MKRKVTNSEVEHVLSVLMRDSKGGPQEEAHDATFLAGYREKLRRARLKIESGPLPIGEWSWRAAPVLLLIVAFLAVSFWSLNMSVGAQADPAEGLLWSVVEEGEPNLTSEQIVEIAVVRSGGR